LDVKSHNGFATVSGMKYASQHCCDKVMDDKLALYRDAVYRIVKTNIVNKVSFVGFRGGDRPNRPHGSAL